jgi:hypothetical protein
MQSQDGPGNTRPIQALHPVSLLLLPVLVLPILLTVQALWRWVGLRLPRVSRTGPVTLILPLTGPAPGLEALLAALAAQTLPPRRLVVGIESVADPAHARVLALAPSCPFPVEIRLAGQVGWRGQKNTNLLAALAAVDGIDAAVVLLDGDIRPQPWWLSAAASPILAGTHDVVTGFRWQLLEGRGAVGQLVAWVDRMAAMLALPGGHGIVWGGTIGLSRRALSWLELPRLLDRALVDDAIIGRAARRRGLRLLWRGALTVPTPVEGDALAQLRFLRRQLQLVRICHPGAWVLVMAAMHLSALGWLLALAWLPDPAALLVALGLPACGLLRAWAQVGIGRRVGIVDPLAGRAAQMLVGLIPVLADGLVAVLGWTMMIPRQIRWRHVRYEVRGPHRVRVVWRAQHPG